MVISTKATTKWGWWWFKNTEMLLVIKLVCLVQRRPQDSEEGWWFKYTEMLLVIKLSWLFQRKQQRSEVDDDSRIQKWYW